MGANVLERLVSLGCQYEGANPRFVAVSIPEAVDLDDVTSILTRERHEWEYAHPTYEEISRRRS